MAKAKLRTCPLCGHKMRREKKPFELRVFQRRTPSGDLDFGVTPEGLRAEHCYENEGCGEWFYDKKTCQALDNATAYVKRWYTPGFLELMTMIRKETKIK